MSETNSQSVDCNHPINYFNEDGVLSENAVSCDSCLSKLMHNDSIIYSTIQEEISSELQSYSNEHFDFKSSLDLDKLEIMEKNSKSIPLPLYLKNYVRLNLNSPNAENSDSLAIRLLKDGIRLLSSTFQNSSIQTNIVLLPSVRKSESSSYFSLNEVNLEGLNLIYKILKEKDDTAYLSIDFSSSKINFRQVNLKRNNRLIYSEKLDNSGVVSFSGLIEGDYTLEFTGNLLTKSLKCTILFDNE